MTHSAAFGTTPELEALFKVQASANIAPEDQLVAIQVHIADEMFTCGGYIASDGNAASAQERLQKLLASDPDAPCYMLIRLVEPGAWLLAAYVPDSAAVRPKMLYSSGRDSLRKALCSLATLSDVHWTSVDDAAVLSEEKLSHDSKLELMTKTERLAIEDAKQTATEAQGEKVTSAALSFPMSPDAAEQTGAFRDGSRSLLVLTITGETITLHQSASEAAPAELRAQLPPDAPSYCIFRWSHEHEGEAQDPVLFIYCCPEHSKVRAKMLHASTKGGVITYLETTGVQVAKSLEVSDLDDLTESLITDEMHPTVQQEKAISKPAPRGGRKLVKRQA
uniref:ADF-H domain-containing protein n=1 Tax=Coccolithus braarudii TaxID=221442 RepID=A0A7S0L591_9EUKA